MKKIKWIGSRFLLVAAFFSVLLTGCVSSRIAWSPDGAHAAIFGGDGLRICDTNGVLSEMVLPGKGLAEWFPDSQRLALVSAAEKQSWSDIEKVVSVEERERIAEGGRTILAEFKAGHNFGDAFNALTTLSDAERNAVAAYVVSEETNKELVAGYWPALLEKDAGLIQLRIGALDGGKLTLGPPLLNSLQKIMDVRISHAGAVLAYTIEGEKKDELQLFVVPVDGSAPPQLVASNTAYCADWSADGRSLIYLRAINEAASGDEVSLGTITRRTVLDSAGKIAIQTNADDLAGLLFDNNNKVRCLPDGRIVFGAADLHLPCTVGDMPQQSRLFALDPDREATVVPLIPQGILDQLPAKMDYYEPSPDGKRVAISGEKGAVVVLTLASGDLTVVQAASGADTIAVPAWRSSSELCYVAQTNGQPAQLALWNNGTNRVLSANWPAEARKGFLDK